MGHIVLIIRMSMIYFDLQGKYELQKTDGVSVEFDPKEGFRLNLNAMTDKPQGSYMCAPQLQRTFDRVYVNVFEKPGWGL